MRSAGRGRGPRGARKGLAAQRMMPAANLGRRCDCQLATADKAKVMVALAIPEASRSTYGQDACQGGSGVSVSRREDRAAIFLSI
jgi:hypothetical protein